MKLKNLKEIVEQTMAKKPLSRESDNFLICLVYHQLGLNVKMPFVLMMETIKKNNYPSMESITRARRKVLEEHPEWKNERVDAYRQQKQEEYKDFARGN